MDRNMRLLLEALVKDARAQVVQLRLKIEDYNHLLANGSWVDKEKPLPHQEHGNKLRVRGKY